MADRVKTHPQVVAMLSKLSQLKGFSGAAAQVPHDSIKSAAAKKLADIAKKHPDMAGELKEILGHIESSKAGMPYLPKGAALGAPGGSKQSSEVNQALVNFLNSFLPSGQQIPSGTTGKQLIVASARVLMTITLAELVFTNATSAISKGAQADQAVQQIQ